MKRSWRPPVPTELSPCQFDPHGILNQGHRHLCHSPHGDSEHHLGKTLMAHTRDGEKLRDVSYPSCEEQETLAHILNHFPFKVGLLRLQHNKILARLAKAISPWKGLLYNEQCSTSQNKENDHRPHHHQERGQTGVPTQPYSLQSGNGVLIRAAEGVSGAGYKVTNSIIKSLAYADDLYTSPDAGDARQDPPR
ncbi:hypothetical protein EMCRGX_G005411 [Ephydatia muelleri]